jgi:hypothetical protein
MGSVPDLNLDGNKPVTPLRMLERRISPALLNSSTCNNVFVSNAGSIFDTSAIPPTTTITTSRGFDTYPIPPTSTIASSSSSSAIPIPSIERRIIPNLSRCSTGTISTSVGSSVLSSSTSDDDEEADDSDISEEQYEEKAFSLLERMPMSTSNASLVAFLTPQREVDDNEDSECEWPSNLVVDQALSNAKAIATSREALGINLPEHLKIKSSGGMMGGRNVTYHKSSSSSSNSSRSSNSRANIDYGSTGLTPKFGAMTSTYDRFGGDDNLANLPTLDETV